MFRRSMITSKLSLIFIIILSTVNSQNKEILEEFTKRCEGLQEFSNGIIDCKFNPDDFLDVPQIIRRHGYPVESHIVTTSDGYLLGLHRIPGARNGTKGRQPVLLQHGLFGSSADWVINGNNSLAFSLADGGYDVWMGNDRGNTYSKGHISLPNWSAQYWNFSWHEMGVYDLPAVVYFITNKTGLPGEIVYVGHSMGCTEFFVFSSVLPKIAKNIKVMIGLGPAAYEGNMRSPIRYLAPFVDDLNWLAKLVGVKDLSPNSQFVKFLSYLCDKYSDRKLCQNVIFLFCSSERNEINPDIIPTILSHDPAGSSVKNLIHYAQEIKYDGNFQYFDYGPKGNMIQYGNKTPPSYPLKSIQVPIYLMYADNDNMVGPKDVVRLSKKLKDLVGMYKVPSKDFSHLDFIFGKYAYDLVYRPILDLLRNYTIYN